MKKIKFITTTAAVLALSASLAIAAPHGKGHGGKRGHGRAEFGEKFAAKLNLTEAQKAQVRQFNESFRERNKAFFQSSRQTMRDYREAKQAGDTARAESLKATLQSQREQMKQLRAEQRAQIRAILTPEQRAQFDALEAERESRHGSRGDKRGAEKQRR
ncbi:MAG TPA: Spy/CpxP family protein refolding chaperone [Thermoanaerobaculia bacterium]|nr:Spy/CpxP family protein refolding chaperone [Thermoanaerobaculia bacterium]